MTTITKKQHYVPAFYLRAWNVPGKDFAHFYDMETGKVLINKPETMLAQNYFYEQQSRFPKNYIDVNPVGYGKSNGPDLLGIKRNIGEYSNYSQENSLRAD